MNKDRMLAFSDGVIAIIITIMVLELNLPHSATLSDLVPLRGCPKIKYPILSQISKKCCLNSVPNHLWQSVSLFRHSEQ
jgi:hypothetical protein